MRQGYQLSRLPDAPVILPQARHRQQPGLAMALAFRVRAGCLSVQGCDLGFWKTPCKGMDFLQKRTPSTYVCKLVRVA